MANLRTRCIGVIALSVSCMTLDAQEVIRVPDTAGAGFEGIAVLPFENLSTRPGSPEFAAELYDDVLDGLRSLNNVYVIGRESVVSYASSTLAPEEIASELGVGTLVEATIEDADQQQLLITVYRKTKLSSGRTRFYRQPSDDAASMASHIVRTINIDLTFRPGREAEESMAERIAAARVIILDARRSDAERLRALYQLPNGPGLRGTPLVAEAKGGAVAIALAQIATSSDDPGVRATIWRLMAGVGDSNLLEPLLYSVANDSDYRVRGEAARALFDFIDEPGVRDALASARDYDPTVRVRNEARLALFSDSEWSRALREFALDTSNTDWERASILGKFYDRDSESRIVPGEFAVTMWQLSRATNERRAQSAIWSFLRAVDDAALASPLLDALQDDSDPHVRSEAARQLHKFRDQPGVSEALQEAQVNDASRDVRRAAASPF